MLFFIINLIFLGGIVVRVQIPKSPVVHSNLVERPFPRLEARGKFLFIDDQKFWVRGVTYGTFHPREDGTQFPAPEMVKRDFAEIAANGMNAVRVYTVPPIWLLDLAKRFRLRVMVGLPWEQHIAFLNEKSRIRQIEERFRQSVRDCARHPVRPITRSGLASFSGFILPKSENIFCSAFSRMEQVFTRIRSASSMCVVRAYPE